MGTHEEGYYYLVNEGEDPVLVHGYYCSDHGGSFGFGFNIYDGGGFIPLLDLSERTEYIKVKITMVH